MSVSVIVKFNVKNQKLAEFCEILKSVKTDLPNVDGCVGVKIFRDSHNNQRFTLLETWQTQQLHEQHIAKITADGTWRFIVEHLSAEPTSAYYEQL